MIIREISKSEFQQFEGAKIKFSGSDKLFGLLYNDDKPILALTWSSDLVPVKIIPIGEGYFIGIDLAYLIISNDEVIRGFSVLNSFFLDSIETSRYIIVISELELILLDKKTFTINNLLGFPDTVVDYKLDEEYLLIKCMDGYNTSVFLG